MLHAGGRFRRCSTIPVGFAGVYVIVRKAAKIHTAYINSHIAIDLNVDKMV